jgi:hypothetical protein
MRWSAGWQAEYQTDGLTVFMSEPNEREFQQVSFIDIRWLAGCLVGAGLLRQILNEVALFSKFNLTEFF